MLSIRGKPLNGTYTLTLCAIVHDEMYFLPAFFAHYRALGVDRFIVLDDASSDGTAEFLAAQTDCMVVEAPTRYFEHVDGRRAVHAWRQELMDHFCRDQWAIFADADEFLMLPPGETVGTVVARLDAEGSDSISAVMVDVYPATVEALLAPDDFDPKDGWFFDAVTHALRVPGRSKPLWIYRGARARLFATMSGAASSSDRGRWLLARLGLAGLLKSNNIGKVPLVRWRAGTRWEGSHWIFPAPKSHDLLTIVHFKFTPDLGRKIGYALDTKGYSNGSRQYQQLADLLKGMKEQGRGFIGPSSAPLSREQLYRKGPGRWRQNIAGTHRTS